MVQITWSKRNDGNWFDFMRPIQFQGKLIGVYIIWHNGAFSKNAEVVRVGQGDVEDRLSAHWQDVNITRHKNRGMLLVTWAVVLSEHTRDGIERFLGDTLKPLEGKRFPNAVPISVNYPWSKS
ncbi:MAG: hypothetical protein ACYYKD_13920 [Rhodospirillales bacterium]